MSRPLPLDPSLTAEIRTLTAPLTEFKPIILYNKELELVEVITADTSYVAVPLTDKFYIDVFERNHHVRYGQEHFVGFNLWVAKGVCAKMGVPWAGKVSMRRILVFLREWETDQFVKDVIAETLLPLLDAHGFDEFEI